MEAVRRALFEWYLSFPRQLERLIGKALGCSSFRFKGVLGQGTYNLVLDAEMGDQRAAIRLPNPMTRPRFRQRADSKAGYGATLFMSQLHLPVLAARLVQAPLPYMPPGKCHFAIMEVAEGVPLDKVWDQNAPLELKKRVLADLAAVAAELYRHPLSALGDMAVSADGRACVGELSTGSVAAAMKRGIDVGQLSPGPYLTWKEYARNQLEGLRLLNRASCPPACLHLVESDMDLLLEWLDKFNLPQERNERFYLYHPELRLHQIMVDPHSGRVESILDWDGAQTGTIHSLGEVFCVLRAVHWGDKDEEALYEFYCQRLEHEGVAELVPFVRSRNEDDPQIMFEEFDTREHGHFLHIQLRITLKMLGVVDPAEKIPPCCFEACPWIKHQAISNHELEETGSSISSSDESSSSSADQPREKRRKG